MCLEFLAPTEVQETFVCFAIIDGNHTYILEKEMATHSSILA